MYYKDLDGVTDQKMSRVTLRSFISVSVVYQIIGILGYATFGENIQPNILENYIAEIDKFGKVITTIITIGYMCTAGLSFPIIYLVCRNMTVSLIQDMRN